MAGRKFQGEFTAACATAYIDFFEISTAASVKVKAPARWCCAGALK